VSVFRRLLATFAVVALAASTGGLAQDGGETGVPSADAAERVALDAVRELARRAAGVLSERTGRTVEPPAVAVGDAEAVTAAFRRRWLDGYPWRSDEERALLGDLGLVDPRFDLETAAAGLVGPEPGLVLDRGRLIVPQEAAVRLLSGDDPLLEAVGLSGIELRILAELARASARERLFPAPDDGSSDSRAARWALGDAYRSHLEEGPRDALRLLVHRLLIGGWPAVESSLDPGLPGTAALDPSRSGRPARTADAEQGHALGPRHLRLALESRGVAEHAAAEIAGALLADAAARPEGRPDFWTWKLVFVDAAAAEAFAAAWAASPGGSVTVTASAAIVSFRKK
jgi:hypothetical protein